MSQPTYFYVVARPTNGSRLVVIGPKNSEAESNELGMTKLEVPFEVVELPTRDRGKATAMIKNKYLESGSGLDAALKPAQHKVAGDNQNGN